MKNFNFGLFFRLTVGPAVVSMLVGFLLAAAGPAWAVEGPAPQPVAVAESELFEVVARLGEDGLVLHVDRPDSNAPVLAAELELEHGGKAVKAVFRPAQGDYLVADRAWLQAFGQPGSYPLAMTVIAGEDSDLLSADLRVMATAEGPGAAAMDRRWGFALALLAAVAAGFWWRRRKGAQA